ncbi:MAG: glutamate mutase L, partial [Dictyoglomus sp.]
DPIVKRTVEGDLGVRVSASALLDTVGEENIKKFLKIEKDSLKEKVNFLYKNTDFIPKVDEDIYFDAILSYFAVKLAVERHVGYLEVVYTPMGSVYFQYGKDLRDVKNIVLTGGPLIFNPYKKEILKGALYTPEEPFILKPKNPSFYIDKEYILFSLGVIGEINEDIALNLLEKYVGKLEA